MTLHICSLQYFFETGCGVICIQYLVLSLVALSGVCTDGGKSGKRQQSQQDGGGASRNAGCDQGIKEVLREIAAT